MRRLLVVWAAWYRILKGVFCSQKKAAAAKEDESNTVRLAAFMVTSQMSPAREMCNGREKLKTRLEMGRGDILLMGTINIPSQWDDGVSLLQKHNE